MDETLDQLAGATIFGSMDLRNGFFQIKMSPESMKYTSFVTYNGQFEWKRMSFGLRNAPNHFQYAMQCCLEPVLRGKCVVFVDDLLVYGTHETFIDNLRSTFECLKKFGLRLKPSK
ncbi:uncharacterized protein LOC118645573, partial [Aduncisulcus paluster]